jgi:acetyl-CoA carboxylase carboxyl transferase subunit beta
MEGRSLADDTQPERMAGEKDEARGQPAQAPREPLPGPDRVDRKAEKADRKREKELEREKQKAERLAEKAQKEAARTEEEPKREGRLSRLRFSKKKDMPGGLWLKCESCSQVIFRKELEEKDRVCPSCGFHFTVPGRERIEMTLDEGSWREHFADLEALDRLDFQDALPYGEKVRRAAERAGQKEALLLGTGTILGRPVVLAVLDFNFMGGSMGEVVGEKIALAAELAVREKRPLVIFTSSGGARMHEGILSLMQMAKTCAALQTLAENHGFSVCVMTHPTTGGVTASFASVTDLILAEPGALIGFAGPRVIATTLKQELPPGFQRAEFLLEKGMLDAIVKRAEMRATLANLIDYSRGARVAHAGALRPKGRG